MAYNTKDLYQKALVEIEKNNLFFIEDVCSYIGVSKPTLYEHFPIDSNEMNDIKERLSKNKSKTKVSLRSKLHKSNSPAGLLALYKLICTDEERRALAMEYKEHSGSISLPKLQVEIVRPDESQ
jgi:hypothetical protein